MDYIAGLDQRAGLAAANGNETLYRRLLSMLVTQQHDFINGFRSALEGRGGREAAIRMAHDLRANASSL